MPACSHIDIYIHQAQVFNLTAAADVSEKADIICARWGVCEIADGMAVAVKRAGKFCSFGADDIKRRARISGQVNIGCEDKIFIPVGRPSADCGHLPRRRYLVRVAFGSAAGIRRRIFKIARIAEAIAIRIGLAGIGDIGAVVIGVTNAVPIGVAAEAVTRGHKLESGDPDVVVEGPVIHVGHEIAVNVGELLVDWVVCDLEGLARGEPVDPDVEIRGRVRFPGDQVTTHAGPHVQVTIVDYRHKRQTWRIHVDRLDPCRAGAGNPRHPGATRGRRNVAVGGANHGRCGASQIPDDDVLRLHPNSESVADLQHRCWSSRNRLRLHGGSQVIQVVQHDLRAAQPDNPVAVDVRVVDEQRIAKRPIG